MFGKKKDKKKKKQPTERFVSLTANGTEVVAYNFAMNRDQEGNPQIEVRTPDVCEALHYDTVDFVMKTTTKQIDVKARFREARDEKKFKLYIFSVDDFNQYYI